MDAPGQIALKAPHAGSRERHAQLFPDGGELGALIRSHDWARNALGPIERWPQSLRTAVGMMLDSHFGMVVAWGPEFRFLYNDRYRPVLGATKHPAALGAPARDIFPEAWDFIGPLFEKTRTGQAVALDDVHIPLNRNGYLEDCWFTISYSPIRDESGGVGGMLAVVAETTERVEAERRLSTLRDLLRAAAEAKSASLACESAAAMLSKNPVDVPYAAIYLCSDDGKSAKLISATGCKPGSEVAPHDLDLKRADDAKGWPLQRVLRSRRPERVSDVRQRFAKVPAGPYREPPHTAVMLPLWKPSADKPYGFLLAGVNAHRALDDKYQTFWDLAAVDRAKTAFFSNVSHEFRTPLTLMLGPLRDALTDGDAALPATQRSRTELALRNAERLQKLVNALLDFSRLEAGRAELSFAPVDIGALTADLASAFRSVMDSAGVRLVVDCASLDGPVWVDAGAWEKVVLNLLSNAFKFTFDGEVRVTLRAQGPNVELRVEDTGTGIPAEAVPRVFERFYRVQGARGRSHEGTGIGLAMVRELVRLHGGEVSVESEVGRGSAFTVTVPRGNAHLPKERLRDSGGMTRADVRPFVDEAVQWTRGVSAPSVSAAHKGARILVADDNADMREYLERLLAPQWHVELAKNGADALTAAMQSPPDLVLADVMMPELDGLQLLRTLRTDARTRTIPVMLLSARAGEEATVGGLDAGADDYLVKPFSASTLLARVRAQLELQAARKEALVAEQTYGQEMSQLLEDARKATRSREETLAVVSHDLRSPLAAIATAAELVVRKAGAGADAEAVKRHTGAIQRQVQRMKRLIDDLLDLAALDAGELKVERAVQSPADLVHEAREAFASQFAEKRVTLTEKVESHLAVVPVDKGRVLQVFTNLLSNALRFSPEGTTVELRAKQDNAAVRFEVADKGPGIPPELRDRLFTRYSKGKSTRGESHGLGLSIAKGIVEAHGGSIGLESREGQGTTFWFVMPEQAPAVKAVAVNTKTPMAPRDELSHTMREEFLSLASHELRTPLTAVHLELDGVRRALKKVPAGPDADKARTKTASALRHAARLTSMVEGVLDAVQIEAGDFVLDLVSFDLADIVHSVVTRLESEAATDLGSSITVSGLKSFSGRWDKKRIERAVEHLVSNAIKHAPGTEVQVAFIASDRGVEIEVKDSGPGIEPQDLKRIFGRFERARPKAHGGLGLGLYVTRHVIEAHGGTVQAESTPGEGTRIVLRLPRYTAG